MLRETLGCLLMNPARSSVSTIWWLTRKNSRMSVSAGGARPAAGIGHGSHPVSAEMTESPRRFPAPWTIEETEACFIVRNNNG